MGQRPRRSADREPPVPPAGSGGESSGTGSSPVVGIGLFAGVSVRAVASAEGDLRQVRRDDLVLHQVLNYRAGLADVQAFVEPQFARLSTAPVLIDPVEIAHGAQLSTDQVAQDANHGGHPALDGRNDDANRIEATSARHHALTHRSRHADPGAAAPRHRSSRGEGARSVRLGARGGRERARRSSAARACTTRRRASGISPVSATHSLRCDAIAAAFVLGGALFLGQHRSGRERLELAQTRRHDFETSLQQALDMAKSETGAYDVVTEALDGSVPHLQVELLVADSGHSRFHQVLHTTVDEAAPARSGCAVESPLECPATMLGHTMIFPTSRALDACPNLKGHASGDLSAACIAVSLTGKTVGVVHATGLDDEPPSADEVGHLEVTARRTSERIAILRTFEKSEAQARTDPLTGLWNRRSLENRVQELRTDGTSYALAYGDLDHFKQLNDTHGHESGDQALRLFAQRTARVDPARRLHRALRRRGVRRRAARLLERYRVAHSRAAAGTARPDAQRLPHPGVHGELRPGVVRGRGHVQRRRRRGRRGALHRQGERP